jgi:hypothetical protein
MLHKSRASSILSQNDEVLTEIRVCKFLSEQVLCTETSGGLSIYIVTRVCLQLQINFST